MQIPGLKVKQIDHTMLKIRVVSEVYKSLLFELFYICIDIGMYQMLIVFSAGGGDQNQKANNHAK